MKANKKIIKETYKIEEEILLKFKQKTEQISKFDISNDFCFEEYDDYINNYISFDVYFNKKHMIKKHDEALKIVNNLNMILEYFTIDLKYYTNHVTFNITFKKQ